MHEYRSLFEKLWRLQCRREFNGVAVPLCAAIVAIAGLGIAPAAAADEDIARRAPIAMQWERDLWFVGESAKLLALNGPVRPFLAAGGGTRRWGSGTKALQVSSRASDEMLAGVSGGLDLRLSAPLVLSLNGGWVHDLSPLYLGERSTGFGTAGARLELRF